MSVVTELRPSRRAPVARDREAVTAEAFRRMRQAGCPRTERDRLRDDILWWNLPVAHRLARGYRQRGENLDDLLQVAALALVKAVDGYDPDRGFSFTAYAQPTILGELKRHFRDRVWGVHVPRQLQERCLEVTRARTDLAQRLQRTPSVSEIAATLGVTDDDVRATDASASAYRCESLNRRVGFDDDACERQDLLGERDAALDAVS
ncbi:MAG: sigma factor, partial [Actinomycetota bacterium]|nr:sigma factor [Actinomycetota bacterium]